MPLPKRQTVPSKAATSTASKSDARFANFESDPKFRLPSKKHNKTKLDPRFSRLRSDPDFYNKATVDKYGRKISKDAGKKAMERLYEAEDDEDDADELELEGPLDGKRDRAVAKELARVAKQDFDPIRDGGLESSSDESSSDDDDEEEVEEQTELAGEGNVVPTGDISARLAAVNMDWDNIRASDIMGVASSFVPAGGKILNVVIYPSEFGMERLQREELEGPPREIFASTANKDKNNLTSLEESPSASEDEDEDEEQANNDLQKDDGEEFDSTALRRYQLDRLRYYYAVITCSSANTAKAIYDNLDGREYLTSANFFDLRFVPDGTTFDQDPHDECDKLPDGYKPNEFTTDALTHSKVKLTWDADDATRKEVQKRAFSRKEIDENELQAYLGENSSSSEDETETAKTDKAASLRAALGLETMSKTTKSKSKPKPSSKRDRDFPKPDGEMQITFTGGLLNDTGKGSVFENEIPVQETTMEAYIRKEKERKARRKERAKARREGRDPDAEVKAEAIDAAADEDDPFNDPFFGSDPEEAIKAEKVDKMTKRAKKREEKEQQEQAIAAERANLELLMANEDDKMRHFDMNEIVKAEKAKKKKGKKAKKNAPVVEDSFKINTNDPRFAKLYESHEFAIDPTNPRFKETAAMKALLEEGRKKRKQGGDGDEPERELERDPKKSKKEQTVGNDDDLKKLAARIKAKSKKA